MPVFGSKTQVEMATITNQMTEKAVNMAEMMRVNIRISREGHMATKKVVYKEMKSTFIQGKKIAIRVSKLGLRDYKVGGKTAEILEKFEKECRRLESADFQLKVMLAPVLNLNVDDIIEEWITKTKMEDELEEKKQEEMKKNGMDSTTGKK
ncbi:hypothetical protein CAEBREN_03539 [Caenorhabditis brenneri]|uniref:Uncharacterized protein n=1 Tax=Caenorhabditis brenneri TaxID=135651 RepID=G0MQW0_CAEBE|nr:hypothetical protein CAEBREN_03539 [Caenorhabditis brenneri]